jgi:hypothetical protein
MTEHQYWTETKNLLGNEKDLEFFKCWTTLLTIPLYSYDEGLDFYPDSNAKYLEGRSDSSLWKSALKEPAIGHKESSHKLSRKLFLDVECSAWTLKSLNHLLAYEHFSNKSIHDYDQIVEFGAGIGETCRIIRDLDYKGEVYICDLPEVSRVSSYYLQKLGKKVTHVDDCTKIDNSKKTLFIATWSLSEVDYPLRNQIAEHFVGQDFLIIYQKTIWDYDNVDYFTNVFPEKAQIKYKLSQVKIAYPDEEHHSFLMVCTHDDLT